MIFCDKTGQTHDTYIGTIAANLMANLDKHMESIPGLASAMQDPDEPEVEVYPDETPDAEEHEGEVWVVDPEDDNDYDRSEDSGIPPVVGGDPDPEVTAEEVTEGTPPPKQTFIDHDFANKKILLKDADGNILKEAPMSDEMLKHNPMANEELEAIYGDGVIPEQATAVTFKPAEGSKVYTCDCGETIDTVPGRSKCVYCAGSVDKEVPAEVASQANNDEPMG